MTAQVDGRMLRLVHFAGLGGGPEWCWMDIGEDGQPQYSRTGVAGGANAVEAQLNAKKEWPNVVFTSFGGRAR